MKKVLFQNKIIVKRSRVHRYGVFAAKRFKKGDILEECYFIPTKGGDKTLEDYYFELGKKYALFLGFGSIYNHSEEPNADYFINKKKLVTTIKATKTIKKGDEIFISYGDEWFKSRNIKPKKSK